MLLQGFPAQFGRPEGRTFLRLTARGILATPLKLPRGAFRVHPSATPDTATAIKAAWVGTFVPASEPVKDARRDSSVD